MCRSFDEVVRSSLRSPRDSGFREGRRSDFDPVWARYWSGWVSTAFVNGYFEAARQAPFVPSGADDLRTLTKVYLLDRTIHELRDALAGDIEVVLSVVGDIAALLAEQPGIDN